MWRPRITSHIDQKIICIFIEEIEIYTIYISCTVYCIQIFPLEAKLQEFKEGPYQKLLLEGEKLVLKSRFILHMKTTHCDA